MVNLDMIGRSRDPSKLAALPAPRRSVSTSIRRRKRPASTYGPGGPGAGRSDDSSFLDRRIPSLHFFTGFHDDYHAPETTGRASTQPGPRASRRSRWNWRRVWRRAPTSLNSPAVETRRVDHVIASAIFIIAALIFINAVYVAAEFSAVGVRRSRIRQLADDGNPFAAWLLPRIESPATLDRYIAACQIGITLSSLALGAYAQRTIAVWLTPVFVGVGGLQVNAGAIDVRGCRALRADRSAGDFAELVPKSLALQYPTQTALHAGADAAVGLAVSPLHQVAERHRPSAAAAHRVAGTGPSPPAFARENRAADRREP